jgi:hypothetical protein
MAKTFNIALPHLNPLWNFEGLMSTVEDEFVGHFVITDNSPNSELKKLHLEDRGARVHYHPENIGVGRAWNLALRESPDYTIILSSSIRFDTGFGNFLDGAFARANDFGLLTWECWHLLFLGKRTIDTIGFIDENFYPAYYEDNDMLYRLKLAGIHDSIEGWHDVLPKYKAPVSSIGDGVALKTGLVNPRLDKLCKYFESKWGGTPGKETFLHPYNNPDNSITYWQPRTIEEARRHLEEL